VDGVLNIDKPEGWTSHDVVARVRRLMCERRVGHTGTLDPFATGVLVVLVGRATRLAQYLAGATKEYEAVIRLGYATDTGDATGERRSFEIESAKAPPEGLSWSDEEIEEALDALRGRIAQVPPMYSAKKVQGRKLYELARQGVEIPRTPVWVTIHELEALRDAGQLLSCARASDSTRDLSVRVRCSAGTYVRTLAESIGERLGVGAHLASLRRTSAGDFKIADSRTLDDLKKAAEENQAASLLLSPDAALSNMPFVHLTADEARRARHGMAVALRPAHFENWADEAQVRMRDDEGNLIAVGVYDALHESVRPRVVLTVEK
jgi:tRNA pseudouridine55 synthase